MNNSKVLLRDFIDKLNFTDEVDEKRAVALLVLEHVFELSRSQLLMGTDVIDNEQAHLLLASIAKRLNSHEPVQYILGEAVFADRFFFVTPDVLIPRPETEELVSLACETIGSGQWKIVDIGTGSGCIPITLALALPGSKVSATDVSVEALGVAVQNAKRHHADVDFIVHDILEEDLPFHNIDLIVSNPPYIAREEEEIMSHHVRHREPHLALFVEGDDPLLFYRKLSEQSSKVLVSGGWLIVEINRRFGKEVSSLFSGAGLADIEIVKDVSGHDRFVKGRKV